MRVRGDRRDELYATPSARPSPASSPSDRTMLIEPTPSACLPIQRPIARAACRDASMPDRQRASSRLTPDKALASTSHASLSSHA